MYFARHPLQLQRLVSLPVYCMSCSWATCTHWNCHSLALPSQPSVCVYCCVPVCACIQDWPLHCVR